MVADASLQNLIPMPSRWGMATKAIRVPLEFLEDIYTMIEEKVQQLKISVGNDTPAEQTEEEWIAEITGLPVGFKAGDELPAEIAEAITEMKRSRTPQAIASEEAKTAVIAEKDWTKEPPRFTREWIEFRESEPNPKNWNWEQQYLPALLEEARNGDASAKAELLAFKANGVDISEPIVAEPTIVIDKKQSKLARRKARADKNPAVSKTIYKPKQKTNYERICEERAIVFERIVNDLREEISVFMRKIQDTCMRGKLEQYLDFLEANSWLRYSEKVYCTADWNFGMRWFRHECRDRLVAKFGGGKPNGNNAEFVRLVTALINAYDDAHNEARDRIVPPLTDAQRALLETLTPETI
jgi:hypothetical protein